MSKASDNFPYKLGYYYRRTGRTTRILVGLLNDLLSPNNHGKKFALYAHSLYYGQQLFDKVRQMLIALNVAFEENNKQKIVLTGSKTELHLVSIQDVKANNHKVVDKELYNDHFLP